MATPVLHSSRADSPLLQAKTRVPPLPRNLVARERLVEQLMTGLDHRLTAVVAPAGWGKTTLLAQWARRARTERAVAWLTLDEGDAEPARFWTYAVTSLRVVAPDEADRALRALRAPSVDPVDVALPTLVNALEKTRLRCVLVLDDYHLVGDRHVHEQVEFLLSYLPESLRLVVAGRLDPPLPMARFRVAGHLAEIRTDDLRFDPVEASELLSRVGRVVVGQADLRALLDRSEGWAAGLQLAALSATATEPAQLREGGEDRHLLDYFTTEVLAQMSADEQDLMLRCSVLDRLNGSLCDAVLQREGSAMLLLDLERRHMFVAALSSDRTWFRCHPLFQDALRSKVASEHPDLGRAVHARAAEWWAAQDEREAAVRHLLASGDHTAAARLLPSSVPWFLQRGLLRTYIRLGRGVDPRVARSHARLCISLAWASAMVGDTASVGTWVDAGDPLITDETEPLDGWFTMRAASLTIRAAARTGDASVLAASLLDAERAVALEVDKEKPGYVVARMALGRLLHALDRLDEAVMVQTEAWRMPVRRHLPVILQLQAAGGFATTLLDAGRHVAAARVCARMTDASRALEEEWGDAAGPALTGLRVAEGRIAYAEDDFGRAQLLLGRACSLGRVCGEPTMLVAALTAKAHADLAAGDGSAAHAALDEAEEVAISEAVLAHDRRELAATRARMSHRPRDLDETDYGPFVETLTDREHAILLSLPGHLSQREIGVELSITLNTVKGYTKSLYRKLGVTSREGAVVRARGLGLI